MDKNYYEILQIDKNASPEIIEKAYKTLAKKYHPDLQSEENKQQSEEILKQINEAYEVLSNSEKRKVYDNSLIEDTVPKEVFNKIYDENQVLKNKLNNYNYEHELQKARRQAYYDAYIQDLKSRGYKIRYKKSLKDYFYIIITIFIVIVILFLLYKIPFVHNFFYKLYLENSIFRFILNLFNGIFNSIFSILKK